MKLLSLTSLIVSIMIISSCQKEKEFADPRIEYLLPYENTSFHVYDTLFVSAIIHSDEPFAGADVRLTDLNLAPVLPAVSIKLLQPDTFLHLSCSIPIDEISLESGDYFIQIHVETEHSSKYKYQKIRLIGVPREFRGLVVLTKTNVNTLKAELLDTLLQPALLGYFPIDFSFSDLNSVDSRLYLGGRSQGDFIAFDVDSLKTVFSLHGYNSAELPFIQGMRTNGHHVVLSTSDGLLRTFDQAGKPIFSLDLGTTDYPTSALIHNNVIIFNLLKKSGAETRIRQCYYPGGGFFREKQIGMKIVRLEALSKSEILLFGNSDAGGHIEIYYPADNGFWQPFQHPLQPIFQVSRIDEGNYMVACADAVYWYQEASQTLSEFAGIEKVKAMAFEDLSNTLVLGKGRDLKFFSFPSAQPIQSLSLADSIQSVHVLYNK